MRSANEKNKSSAMLGVGLDSKDEQKRMTRGKNFLLVGGSEDTHGVMQETAVKINEKLDHRGKRLEDVSPNEFQDIVHDVTDSIGGKPPSDNN